MPDLVQEEIKAKIMAALTECGECTLENVERTMSSKIYDLDDLIDIKEYKAVFILNRFHMNKYITAVTFHLLDSAEDARRELYQAINGKKKAGWSEFLNG